MSELRKKLDEFTFHEKIKYLTDKVNSLKNPFLAKFAESILELFDALKDDYEKLEKENKELKEKLEKINETIQD